MESSQKWIETLGELRDAARACVMVVVTEVEGSAPREPGARMLVADDRLLSGTIGGGNLEKQAIEHASAILRDASLGSETVAYPLAEKTGQCCGGRVTLFFEPFRWTRHTVAIFGAGHVGQALGSLAPFLEADVELIDGREEAELQPKPPAASRRPYELVCVDAPEGEIDRLPDDALVLIMTHSHTLDQLVLECALKRGTFPYIGLIGSQRKWRRFQARLSQKGFSEEALASVRCPIGVSQVAKTPSAIALSTATELVEVIARLGQTARS